MNQKTTSKSAPELPAFVHAETTVLGSILFDSAYYQKVVDKLDVDDFSLESHQRIFLRMTELMQVGSAIDYVTMVDILERKKDIDSVGGRAYIASLTEGLPLKPAVIDYLRIMREKRHLRAIISLCERASAAAWDQATPATQIAEELVEGLYEKGVLQERARKLA